MSTKGMLIDITRCVGCGQCHDACAAANGNPETPADTFSDISWTAVVDKGDDTYVRRLCMHCEHPTCASVCPVAALRKTEDGPVTYEEDRCIGCRYCMAACPFEVPKYEWTKRAPRVRKCIMCAPRLARGESTACSEACPTGATQFGEREALLEEARARIRDNPEAYYPAVYGDREVGGTSVLFLGPPNLASLGFPGDLHDGPLPELTYRVLSKIPNLAIVGGSALLGIYWIINRRMTLAREDGGRGRSGSQAATTMQWRPDDENKEARS